MAVHGRSLRHFFFFKKKPEHNVYIKNVKCQVMLVISIQQIFSNDSNRNLLNNVKKLIKIYINIQPVLLTLIS